MSSTPPRARRILGEIVLITGSILLAFALEAWWERRGEAEQFQEVVQAVQDEFAGAQVELDRASAVHAETILALTALLELMGPDPTQAAMQELYPLWGRVRYTSTDIPEGVLSSLIEGGGLAGIDDVELRTRLSRWPSRVGNHMDTEALYTEAMEQLRRDIGARSPAPWGAGVTDYETRFPNRPRAVLSDFVVENSMGRTRLLLQVMQRENRVLRDEVGSLLAELAGLAGGG